MSKQRKALLIALDALNRNDYLGWQANIPVMQLIREALAEPEPWTPDDLDMVINAEPVAWMCPHDPERETAFSWRAGMCESSGCGHQRIPLYTAPPARKPLTDDEIKNALMVDPAPIYRLMTTGCIAGAELNEILKRVARAIERAHGIGDE